MEKIKTAIIGCGAITEKTHLPVLLKSDDFNVSALIDIDTNRAMRLGEKYNIPIVSNDYREIIGEVNAAILALPPHINASVSTYLLQEGLHLLVDKPMAMKVHECDAMIHAAENSNKTLMVGLIRRYFPNFLMLKRMLDSGIIGDLQEVSIHEGGIFKWNVKTDYSFRKDTGGGLLPSIGVHVFDSILWWLGEYNSIEYYDDSCGGVEADCRIVLGYANGLNVEIILSRLRGLRNTYIFKGEYGCIETGIKYNSPIHISFYEQNKEYKIFNYTQRLDNPDDLFINQYKDFAKSISFGKQPYIDGYEGKKSVALIEKCYQVRHKALSPGFMSVNKRHVEQMDLDILKNKKFFITGGTGFIGGRLIEMLFDYNITNVRVLVSNYTNASRIARFPVTMIQGDITNVDDVRAAMAGSDIVIHSAYGNKGDESYKRKVDVEGTRNILENAKALGVERVIHLSTMMVYGKPIDGILTEDHPLQYTKQSYPDNKIDAEKLVFQYYTDYGLPVCVLQPTAVYGPFAPTWTVNILKRLKKQRMMLINNGEGFCNAVYVDDVVQALLRASIFQKAIGETFLISYSSPVTWKEYFSYFENMLGYKSTLDVTEKEALKLSRKYSKKQNMLSKAFKYIYDIPPIRRRIQPPVQNRLKRSLVMMLPGYENQMKKNLITDADNRTVYPLTSEWIRFYKSKVEVSTEKAQKLLGYNPTFSLEKGMEKTRLWIEWANLINS